MPFLDPKLFTDVERLDIVLDLHSSNNTFIRLGEVPEDVCKITQLHNS